VGGIRPAGEDQRGGLKDGRSTRTDSRETDAAAALFIRCFKEFDTVIVPSGRTSHVRSPEGRHRSSGLGSAGGHDRRAGGAIVLPDPRPETVETLLSTIRRRLLDQLHIDEQQGRRLLNGCAMIAPP